MSNAQPTSAQPSAARRHGAERAHAVRRLVALYLDADPETRQAGRRWYSDASRAVERLASPEVPYHRAAAIVAALSPRTRWRENLRMAEDVIARRPVGGLRKNIAKAEAIRDGAELTGRPGDALGGDAPKVRAFWRNIIGDGWNVTLDVWATRAATGGKLDAPRSTAEYARLAEAYKRAAEAVGERPCDFQAIVWLVVRPDSENGKDAQRMEVLAA